jgi:hypothetical protein
MPDTATGIAASGQPQLSVSREGMAVVDGSSVRIILGKLPNGDYGIWIADASGNVLIDGSHIILTQASGQIPIGVTFGLPETEVTANGIEVTDGTRMRATLGNLGTDYGIKIVDASGNALIDGSKIQLAQSTGTVPSGVVLGNSSTTITANGVQVSDGTRARATLGHIGTDYGIKIVDASGNVLIDGAKIILNQSSGTVPSGVVLGNASTTVSASGIQVSDGTLVRAILGHLPDGSYGVALYDAYGGSLLEPQGFGAAWVDFIHSGIYNSQMSESVAGALTLGTSRTDATGETSGLPFWTAWRSSGSGTATVVASTSWPGGNYVQFAFSAVGTITSNNVAITTDLVPVEGGSLLYTFLVAASNQAAGAVFSDVAVRWYTAGGGFISSTDSAGPSCPSGTTAEGIFTGAAMRAPLNARYARVELTAWEQTTHSASNWVRFGLACLAPGTESSSIDPTVAITLGPTFVSGELQVGGDIVTNSGGGIDSDGQLSGGANFRMYGYIAPSLTASVNDWAPTGLSGARTVKISSTGAYSITGMAAGSEGEEKLLNNASGSTLTLPHNSASSAAANRWYCPGAASFSLTTLRTVLVRYDGDVSRWCVVG